MSRANHSSVDVNHYVAYERAIVIIGATILALLALAIAPSITPWVDEVQFADPVINLALEGRFTSGAWPYQGVDEYFLGNAPLYSLLVAAWVTAFGVSAIAVRALNPLLFIGVAWLLSVTLTRSKLITRSSGRLIALMLIAVSYGTAFDVWNARYDVLGMLVTSALLVVATMRPSPLRSGVLTLLSTVLVTAGFHLAVLCVVVLALVFLFYRSVYRATVFPIASGVALGVAVVALPGLLSGRVKEWVLITFGSQHSIVGQVGQAVVLGDNLIFRKVAGLLRVHIVDPSLGFLLIVATSLAILSWRRGELAGHNARLVAFLLTCGWLIPVLVGLIGKFPVYYAWMAIIPAAFAIGLLLENGTSWRISLVTMLIAAIGTAAFGAGRLLSDTLYGAEDVACEKHLEKSIRASIAPSEWVYVDFPAYFMVKRFTTRVLTPTYGRTRLVSGIPDWERLSYIVVAESDAVPLIAEFGGQWEVVDSGRSNKLKLPLSCRGSAFNLVVYARKHR